MGMKKIHFFFSKKFRKNRLEKTEFFKIANPDFQPKITHPKHFCRQCKYRISEWAEFEVWTFFHLQKLAYGKKSLPPKGCRPEGGKAFLPTG
jgi:hypothetical protein